MVILTTRNKITDFLMILAWASPFKVAYPDITMPYPDYIVQSPAILLPYRDVKRS